MWISFYGDFLLVGIFTCGDFHSWGVFLRGSLKRGVFVVGFLLVGMSNRGDFLSCLMGPVSRWGFYSFGLSYFHCKCVLFLQKKTFLLFIE